MSHTRVIKLEANSPTGTVRFLSGLHVNLDEGKRTSTVTVTRAGSFTDPRYGRFEISQSMLLAMVANFNEGAYGQDIFIDVAHKPENGAAGKVVNLSVEGNRLRARVEWTDFGIQAVKEKGYQYLSAEYHENYKDNEAGKEHGPVLLGAALTVRPVIKRLDPVQLSEDGPSAILIHPELLKTLNQEISEMKDKYLKLLAIALATISGLTENTIKQLSESFGIALDGITEDATAKVLLASYAESGKLVAKQLAEHTGKEIKLDITIPDLSGGGGGKMLSEDDVLALMAKQNQAAADDQRKLSERLTANQNIFNKVLDESEGIKALSLDQVESLKEAGELITADMTELQVRKLAEHQLKLGDQIAVQMQLSQMGYDTGAAGSVRITVDESNQAKSLQETILTSLRGTSQHSMGKLALSEKISPFADQVLTAFDRIHGRSLAQEAKALAGGTTGMADTHLPVGFQRTVIREVLSDLRVLELVQTLTDPRATATTDIPYEERDTSAVLNDGIVYEGQGIHRASVSQAMDLGYILPMKLAFLISEEVMHFTVASAINWDAYARNVESNARVMRELIVRRICNEMQRSADAYLAGTVSNEGIDGQLDGATVHTVKTAQFPIVRQHQQYDLKGNAIGSPENPIVVRLDGTAIDAYDGSNTQSAGTYYRITNYNLGYVQFVDQTGSPVTPANAAGADDISYDYATNIVKFDTDHAVDVSNGKHLDGLLSMVGARKAVMSADRFIDPDFMLMSPILNDVITNADQYQESNKKSGTDLTGQGNLATIKSVGAFSTNAPAVDLGDERLIMGQRGTLTYTIAKPFMTGAPFEAVNSGGLPTGQKQAYGTEFSSIKVPTPIRNRLTSVLAYSAAGR